MSDSKTSSPRDEAQKLVDKAGDGWQVYHAQPARVTDTSGEGKTSTVVTVAPGQYVAHKRDPNTTTLLEQSGDTPEQLADRIRDWEAARPSTEPARPSEEQLMNSAKATLHMAVTSDARPAIDVDLTPAADKAKPKAKRLRVPTQIEEVKLDAEDQRGIVEARGTPAAATRTDGLGGEGKTTAATGKA